MNIKKDYLLNSLTAGLLILGALSILYVITSQWPKISDIAKRGNLDCVKETQTLVIVDDSMSGTFENGSSVQILPNFYTCNEPHVGDYVAYKFSESAQPVVRKVAGQPGDTFKVVPDAAKNGRWWIEVNNQRVHGYKGDYFIDSDTIPPLKTHSDFRSQLAPDEFILLSENSPGLSDSSSLGPVHKKDLVGKVLN